MIELPHDAPADAPGWAENFCLHAYDPVRRLGLWCHIGSVPGTPGLWRDITAIFLPDGSSILASKSFGRQGDERGPGGGMLRLRCLTPFEDFRLEFAGRSRRVEPRELRSSALTDGVFEPVQLDLRFAAASPAWLAGGHVSEQAWARFHLEQLCRVSGTMSVGGEQVLISGIGIRDHSTGPRDFGAIRRHVWISGQADDGTAFSVTAMQSFGDIPDVAMGFVVEKGTLYDAEPVAVPYLEPGAEPGPEELILRFDGREAAIRIERHDRATFGLIPPNELTVGCSPGASTSLVEESNSRFDWSGKTLHGLTERSMSLVPASAGAQRALGSAPAAGHGGEGS